MCKKKKNIYDRVPRAKEILSYFRLWVDGKADVASQGNPFLVKKGAQKLQQRLHKGSEGNKLFYREFHVSAKDAIDYLKTLDGIKELIY